MKSNNSNEGRKGGSQEGGGGDDDGNDGDRHGYVLRPRVSFGLDSQHCRTRQRAKPAPSPDGPSAVCWQGPARDVSEKELCSHCVPLRVASRGLKHGYCYC